MSKKKSVWGILLILFVLVSFCIIYGVKIRESNLRGPIVLTVNGENVYKDEIMYYFDLGEQAGGTVTAEEVLEDAIYHEIFYQKAVEAGFAMKKEKASQKISYKNALAEKYVQELRRNLPVDRATATSLILEEDYRGYKVEYICVPTVDLYEAEKEKALKKANCFLSAAKEGKEGKEGNEENEFSKLIPETDTESEYLEVFFLEGDELIGPNFEEAAKKLANNEITQAVVEEADGYYLIKMKDRRSLEGYDEMIARAVEEAAEKEFRVKYEEIKKDSQIRIKDTVWESIKNGGYISE